MPSSHHDLVRSQTVRSQTVRAAPVHSEPVQSEPVQSDLAQSDLAQSDLAQSEAPSIAPDRGGDVVEYIVRPDNDSWRIEHAGGSYGPYKSRREATFFAIDAARKLVAAGKNTRVKAIDQAGHLLTTWQHPAPGR